MMNFIGNDYPPIESDILLLDISKNEEYVWTTLFQPSVSNNKSPLSPNSPSSTSSPLSGKLSTPVMIGVIVGSLLVGSLLSFGIFFLYRRYSNKQKRKSVTPISRSEDHKNSNPTPVLDYRQEVMRDDRPI